MSAVEVEAPPTTAPDVSDLGGDGAYAGWFCVATAPYPCPADGCGFVAGHLTAAHMILVWERSDDRMLLTAARDARDLGRNPAVTEYRPELGRAIGYLEWVAAGRPVHGVGQAPDGWGDSWRRL